MGVPVARRTPNEAALAKAEQGQGCRQAARDPVTGKKDGNGAVPQGSREPGEACQGTAAAAAPQGMARPLPAVILLPPPACLSRQLLSPAPQAGSGSWAGRLLLSSLMLQLAPRSSQQLNEENTLLCLS